MKYGIIEFLKLDEEKVYNRIIQKLDMNQKWSDVHTDQYARLIMKNWEDDFEMAK